MIGSLILLFVFLGIIGVGAYFIFGNKKKDDYSGYKKGTGLKHGIIPSDIESVRKYVKSHKNKYLKDQIYRELKRSGVTKKTIDIVFAEVFGD